MLDFFSTAYKTYKVANKYKSAVKAAQDSYESGHGLDDIVDAFVSNTDEKFDDELADSLKKYLNTITEYAELGTKYCWESVTFIEENLPRLSSSINSAALKAEEVVPSAVKSLRMGAQKLDDSSDDITQKLSELGTALVKLNLRLGNIRHGQRR
jgi:uncharacterized phage infection (PIP) family protein YhgE